MKSIFYKQFIFQYWFTVFKENKLPFVLGVQRLIVLYKYIQKQEKKN